MITEVGTMAKLVDAVDVSAFYGSFKAIDSITMTIEPKSVFEPPPRRSLGIDPPRQRRARTGAGERSGAKPT